MTTVLLIAHLLIAAGLVAVILMQKSEGGALGIGGGPGGMMSGRSAANLLTRVTMFLGAAFVVNSILLAIVAGVTDTGDSIFDGNGQVDELTTEDLFGNLGEDDGEDSSEDTPPEETLESTPEPSVPSDEDETEEPRIPG